MKDKRLLNAILIFSFFISGFSALAFQVLWVRLISLFFGHTIFAISAVLTVFMAGLALGSWLATKFKINKKYMLLLYMCVEAGIGVFGLVSKPLIYASNDAMVLLGILELPLRAQFLSWFAVSFLILIIPTTLMGATLPLLSEICSGGTDDTEGGKITGLLYGFNTLGAVLGTALYGFAIIRYFGMSKGILIASAGNLASALAVLPLFLLFKNSPPDQDTELTGPVVNSTENNTVVAALALSGFAGMAVELAWSRAFASMIGSSTYAFSVVLITFLAGLSSGSICFGLMKKRFKPTLTGLGIIELTIAASIIALTPSFNYIPYLLLRTAKTIYSNSSLLLGAEFIICFSVMFVPTFLMGLSFPWAVSIISSQGLKPGKASGISYSFNTIGSIAGSFATGFFWLPLIGSQNTIISAAFVYLATAVFIWFFSGALIKYLYGAAAAALAATAIFIPSWDQNVISSGMFMYARSYESVKSYKEFMDSMHQQIVLYFKDGLSSTISVLEGASGERHLRTNGKTDASSTGDRSTQLLLGYIPFLYHSGAPRNALVIGLGSGTSLGALAAFAELEKIDCIEIEPAVKEASNFFLKQNRMASEDKRVNLIYTDARHFLSSGNNKYDLITSEPSNPWIAGIANLYTKEAFELARKKLEPEGIFCQWLQSYSFNERDFKMILGTFGSVFPYVMVINPQPNDYFLLGKTTPFIIDTAGIQQQYDTNALVGQDMETLGYPTPISLIAGTYVMGNKELKDYTGVFSIHTDDKPTLEFTAPLNLLSGNLAIADNLKTAKKNLLPENLKGFNPSRDELALTFNLIGESFLRSPNPVQARQCFNKVLELDPKNARGIVNLGRVENLENNPVAANALFQKAISVKHNYALAYFHLGMLYSIKGLDEKSLEYFEKGLKLSPGDPMGSLQAARIYRKKGETAKAKYYLKNALSLPIHNQSLRNSLQKELLTVN